MIEKIYEISCDNCSHTINHTFYKPTIKDLKEDNIISIHIDNSIVQ